MPPGPDRVVHILVLYNQDPRGYVVQKHKMIEPGFFHIYHDWDKSPTHLTGGRGFGESQIDEAIAYAKERLFKQKFEPEPKDLKIENWTVYEPKSYAGRNKTHYFNSFEEAQKFYKEVYSKLELI